MQHPVHEILLQTKITIHVAMPKLQKDFRKRELASRTDAHAKTFAKPNGYITVSSSSAS